jgi:hypothetical protein
MHTRVHGVRNLLHLAVDSVPAHTSNTVLTVYDAACGGQSDESSIYTFARFPIL